MGSVPSKDLVKCKIAQTGLDIYEFAQNNCLSFSKTAKSSPKCPQQELCPHLGKSLPTLCISLSFSQLDLFFSKSSIDL